MRGRRAACRSETRRASTSRTATDAGAESSAWGIRFWATHTPSHVRGTSKTRQRHVKDTSKTLPRHSRDTPETLAQAPAQAPQEVRLRWEDEEERRRRSRSRSSSLSGVFGDAVDARRRSPRAFVRHADRAVGA